MSPYLSLLAVVLGFAVLVLLIVGSIGLLSFLRRRRADAAYEIKRETSSKEVVEVPVVVNPLVPPAELEPVETSAEVDDQPSELAEGAEVVLQIDAPEGPNESERTVQRLIDYLER
ncbi:MAG: hypothetical protein K8L99_08880 [Anaerolineae bacterium]|nr:hypothetical protein [Anaerolineae bacterium]